MYFIFFIVENFNKLISHINGLDILKTSFFKYLEKDLNKF